MTSDEDAAVDQVAPSHSAMVADLFAAHGRRLVGALTVYTGDAGDAEELAQEAFARVYAARRRIDEPAKAVAYLYSTGFNLARTRWRRGRALERALHRRGVSDPTPEVETIVVQTTMAAATTAAVTALPARQRACVVLRYYGELPVVEVAEVLGISSNSVKTHLQRGLATLRLTLGSEAPS